MFSRSSRGSRHYHRDDRDRSYSDDDRYERDKEHSSRKSHREGSNHSSHHSRRKHRSRSHSRDSRTTSRRRHPSRSHSRDSQSSYQSDHHADKDKKSPSSKRKKEKKEKKDKKKRRKAEKERAKEDSSDSKPPPHVIVGKVGRIGSKRTLGKDKKSLEGDTVPASESEKVELDSAIITSSTSSVQSILPVATNVYPSMYPTQSLTVSSHSVYATTPQYNMSATFYQQPSTGQVPYYPMGSYGDYQTGSVYDPSLYQQTVQEQGAIQSGEIGQQHWTGETNYGTMESVQAQEMNVELPAVTEEPQCEEGMFMQLM